MTRGPTWLEASYDVVVVGGGMAGCTAALSAARVGRRVLLVERNAFLGGAATAGMVGQFVGWQTRSGRQVIRGVAEEIVERLRAEGGAGGVGTFTMSTGHVMNRVEYNAEILKFVLDEMLTEAGVDILFKATTIGCETRVGNVASVDIWAAGKRLRATAPTFLDASGDMSLLEQAGAEFLALDEGEALQPGTTMFAIAPVEFGALEGMSRETRDQLVAEGVVCGALPRAALHYSRAPGSDAAWFNISRVSVDPEDPFSKSRGEIEGRRQALEIARYLIARVPGCAGARARHPRHAAGARRSCPYPRRTR